MGSWEIRVESPVGPDYMTRVAEFPVEPMFTARRSPRAMTGEPLATEEVLRLLEAAHWAPSSGNGQPWRFVWAHRGSPTFDALFATLAEGNRPWCANAGAFVLVASATTRDGGKPIPTHAFDTGAAWMSLALQGSAMRLVVHAMAGFDAKAAADAVALTEGHAVHCLVAVGRPGRAEELPEPYRSREVPSGRRPLGELAFEGKFPAGG